MLFYAEPARTYDVDVFILLQAAPAPSLLSLASLYDWARGRGFEVNAEHVLVHGVPVQFLRLTTPWRRTPWRRREPSTTKAWP